MTKLSEREKLAKTLWNRIKPYNTKDLQWDNITEYRREEMRIHADYILFNKKCIVDPLVKHNSNHLSWNSRSTELHHARIAIDETIKRAGVEL